MNTHTTSAARFLAIAFSVILLAISATTSFAFFVEFFPEIIPGSVLAREIGALVSGAIGVILFDVATVVWLLLFLHDAQTPQQRAVALILTVFTFIGSAAASVAYLSLTAQGSMDVLDTSTKTTVASFALVVVLLGIVANFGASQMYNRYSYDNIMKVSEANRRDRLLSAEFEQAGYLDSLIEQQVKEKITAIAPSLAEEQARRLVDKFHRGELAKYAHEDGTAALPAPASQPKTTGAVDGRHSIPSPSPDSERRARIDNDPTNDPHVYKPYPNVTIFDAPDNATENFTNGNGRSM